MRGLIFGGAYIRRGLSTEGSLRFKIDWASRIVGSKFTVFAMFYFVFEGNFPSTSPPGGGGGGLYLEGRFNGEFFALPVWGAYTWRGLFSEFYGRYSRTFMCDYLSLATTPISDHILGGRLRKVREKVPREMWGRVVKFTR